MKSATLALTIGVVACGGGETTGASAQDEQSPGPVSWIIARSHTLPGCTPQGDERVRDCAVSGLSWSPDGTNLAVSDEQGRIVIYAAGQADPIATYQPYDDYITAIAYDPAGVRIASAAYEGHVAVLTAADGAEVMRASFEDTPLGLAWSPDGERLAIGRMNYDRDAMILDPQTGEGVLTLSGHPDSPASVVWSADGAQIIVGGDNNADDGGAILRWDTATGELLATYGDHDGRVSDIAVSPDGSEMLAAGYDFNVRRWAMDSDTAPKAVIATEFSAYTVEWTSDDVIAMGGFGDGVRLYAADTMKQTGLIPLGGEGVGAAVFNPAGDTLALGFEDGQIQLFTAP